MLDTYAQFLAGKAPRASALGAPTDAASMPAHLADFQAASPTTATPPCCWRWRMGEPHMTAQETMMHVIPRTQRSDRYLIKKGAFYYRPNCHGYTDEKADAGRYTLAEAIRQSHPNGPDGPRDGMSYIHEDEVPESRLSAAIARAEKAEAERDAAAGAARMEWQPMETAPKNATRVLLRYPAEGWNKPQVIVAHWAHGGGDEQPPFGPGWFYAVLGKKGEILMFAEAPTNPDAWMPMPDSTDA